MAAVSTVRLWALDDVKASREDTEGFAALYARARLIGYHQLLNQIREIADTAQQGTVTKVTEKGAETRTGDMIDHRRLQIDARKWILAKPCRRSTATS